MGLWGMEADCAGQVRGEKKREIEKEEGRRETDEESAGQTWSS